LATDVPFPSRTQKLALEWFCPAIEDPTSGTSRPETNDHRPSIVNNFTSSLAIIYAILLTPGSFCETSNSCVCLCAYLAAGHLKFVAGERGNFGVEKVVVVVQGP